MSKMLFNFTEAEQILGITRPTLLKMIKKGEIKIVIINESKKISRHELERLIGGELLD